MKVNDVNVEFRVGRVQDYDLTDWTPLEIERLECIEPLIWYMVPLLIDRDRLIDDIRD